MEEDSHPGIDDVLAALRAQGDQAIAAATELAGMFVSFRRTLIEGGFSPSVADAIASTYAGTMFQAAMLGFGS